jgi:FtsH-binding integral membrane protein
LHLAICLLTLKGENEQRVKHKRREEKNKSHPVLSGDEKKHEKCFDSQKKKKKKNTAKIMSCELLLFTLVCYIIGGKVCSHTEK